MVNLGAIERAAKLMRKTPQYIRVAMQRGILPIGIVQKMPGSLKYNYFISEKLFREYSGMELWDESAAAAKERAGEVHTA